MEPACLTCRLLAESLQLYEESLPSINPYSKPVDFFIGSSDDIQSRHNTTGCAACQSILLSVDHSPNSILTVHFSVEQPRVCVVAGEADGREATLTLAARKEILDTGTVGDDLIANYFLTTKNVTLQEPHGRLVNPSHVDLKLIESWINKCDVSHQKTCHRLYDTYLLPSAPLSFIDVYSLCIVTPPPVSKGESPPRYTALSYVWGTARVQLALKENITELRRPGAFGVGGGYVLPRTVRDAIELTAELGVRYLWVDSVCIVQDDEEGQKEQLRGMGAVYANAYLTIVASSGEDANAGIHRVGSAPLLNGGNEPVQRIIALPGHPLIKMQDGRCFRRETLDSPNLKWNTRGWTLQEKVFSRRLLALGDVASWTCFGEEWTEDVYLPSESTGFPLSICQNDKKKMGVVTWPSISAYSTLATEYAKRDLAWSADAINAFLGVMTPMSQWFPGGVLHGIAEYTFDIGLLWDVGPGGAHLRRDPGTVQTLHAGHIKHSTWSWVSLQGDLRLDTWKAAEDYSFPRGPLTVSPLAKWHKQVLTGEWVEIDNTYHVVRKHFERKDTEIPPEWTRHVDGQSDRVYYQSERHNHVVPQPAFTYPIPPHVRYRDIDQRPFQPHIRFQGQLSRARVHITELDRTGLVDKLSESDATLETDLISNDGFWCGQMTIPLEKGDEVPSMHEVEVIAISEGVLDLKSSTRIPQMFRKVKERPEFEDLEFYEVVNVLSIGRCANGMVYRKALGGIWKRAWELLDREDVELLLT